MASRGFMIFLFTYKLEKIIKCLLWSNDCTGECNFAGYRKKYNFRVGKLFFKNLESENEKSIIENKILKNEFGRGGPNRGLAGVAGQGNFCFFGARTIFALFECTFAIFLF
jgi:hypothetical protein